ncbi:hypothetical protein UlMin_018960 [Ulmus minor]
MVVFGSLCQVNPSPIPTTTTSSPSSTTPLKGLLTRRRALLLGQSAVVASLIHLYSAIPSPPSLHQAIALQPQDELLQEEDQVVHLFQETSPSVVFIKNLEIDKSLKESPDEVIFSEDKNFKVEGTGSGFIWDRFGHIVTNYHVIAKLATDTSGFQRCNVNVDGYELKPVVLGTSRDLHVGQSCFSIGNPYGYENTLTTGVVSGLGREIPSPNGRAIRGAIQTDAAINAGNSGGPLIDSYGHVIGVNTSTFTRKGTGVSSGVNFAIPIDTVMKTVPYLIVYGTPYSDRF